MTVISLFASYSVLSAYLVPQRAYLNWILLCSCCSDNIPTSFPILFSKSASMAIIRSCLSDTDGAACAIESAISYRESASVIADLAVSVVAGLVSACPWLLVYAIRPLKFRPVRALMHSTCLYTCIFRYSKGIHLSGEGLGWFGIIIKINPGTALIAARLWFSELVISTNLPPLLLKRLPNAYFAIL